MMFEQADPEAGAEAQGLCRFLDASPSPYHAAAAAAALLAAAGFARIGQADAWAGPERALPPRGYVVREGSLVAWDLGAGEPPAPATPFRVVGAHTDSPNLRVKPRPDLARGAWDQLAVEVYGGPLLNSWLDRDLGLSGRVMLTGPGAGGGVQQRLVRVDDPVLRIPQLAVHLDRAVTTEGLRLNPQTHLVPVWGATGAAPSFASYLSELLQVPARDILGWDVMTHDLTPARIVGRTGDLIASARLDNLASSYAATRALMASARGSIDPAPGAGVVPVVVLFDHEEIGSTTDRGASSPLLMSVLERLVLARGGGREDLWRALAGTVIASADMAHAVHPNYPERHEPQHQPTVNAGPVVKVNNLGRYATEGPGTAVLRLSAEQAGVPLQVFVSRGDMPCGSTIGPFAAAATGATTVDLGCAMLGMHSARELAGSADPASYVALLAAFLRPRGGVGDCTTQ